MALTKVSSKTLSDNAVTSDKIASGAISVSDMADNSITTAKLHTSVQGALGTRNLIINGDMRIAQRGTTATGLTNGSAGIHTVDRWRFAEGGTPTFVWTMSQDTDVPSGQGFSNSLKWDCTTADASLAANDVFYMRYRIEAQNLQHLKFGTSNAESLTLSFWTKSNKTGTYIVEFWQPDSGNLLSQTYTIDSADTWEKKTITISGDTSGQIDNDNGNGFELFFWYCAGTDYTSGTLNTSWSAASNADRAVGLVNLADSTSNYINITGVQLEVGENATEFEHRPYDMELQRCMRYYQTSFSGESGPMTTAQPPIHWTAYSGSIILGSIIFNQIMRATPTMVLIGAATGTAGTLETVTNSAVSGTWTWTNPNNKGVGQANGSGTTAGSIYQANFTADAEL